MNPVRQISAIFKKMDKRLLDPTEQAVRESTIALEHKIESMRKSEGPEAAAIAAAAVAAEAEKASKDADLKAKIAKAAAKSARKKANEYRKGASRAAGTASAAGVDSAAKDAAATRMIQSDAIDEVEEILSGERRASSTDSPDRKPPG